MKILLAETRIKSGLSQIELSRKSGVARSYISEMESGKYNNPRVLVLYKLSKVLNCKIDDLLSGEEE